MHRLLDDTDAALARQTLLQVASLPDRTDASGHKIDPSVPQWNFEIPFATPQGTAMAQFEISRDGGNESADPARRAWRARFTLNVEPDGPVHALITLNGDKTFVRMWAERPTTAQQLRAAIGELNQALTRAELKPGDILVRDGTPPQPATGPRRPLSGSRYMSDPSKLAIALHYERGSNAPVVVAKGKGTIGEKIVEIAKANDIPIEENEILAGALSKVELGEEIPPDLYKAVAEVLVFVLRLSGRR
ncbi:FlhB-like protein [Bradyrhizobium sp. GM5.1]